MIERLTWVWPRPPRIVLEPSFEDSAPHHIFRNWRRGALSWSTGVLSAAPVPCSWSGSLISHALAIHQKAWIACGAGARRPSDAILPALPQLGLYGKTLARRSLREMLGYRGRRRNEPLAHADRQIVDKRIGARRVPPNDWPDVSAPPPLPWDDYEDEPWDVTDMPGIGSEPPLAQPDPAEPDLAQPDPAEPDLGERSLDCMRCRSEDAQRQARQEAGG